VRTPRELAHEALQVAEDNVERNDTANARAGLAIATAIVALAGEVALLRAMLESSSRATTSNDGGGALP